MAGTPTAGSSGTGAGSPKQPARLDGRAMAGVLAAILLLACLASDALVANSALTIPLVVAAAVAAGVAGAVAGAADRAVAVCTGAGAGSETRVGEAQPASSARAASGASSVRWVVYGIVIVVFLLHIRLGAGFIDRTVPRPAPSCRRRWRAGAS